MIEDLVTMSDLYTVFTMIWHYIFPLNDQKNIEERNKNSVKPFFIIIFFDEY